MTREIVHLYKCKKMLKRVSEEAKDQLGFTSRSTIKDIDQLLKDIEDV